MGTTGQPTPGCWPWPAGIRLEVLQPHLHTGRLLARHRGLYSLKTGMMMYPPGNFAPGGWFHAHEDRVRLRFVFRIEEFSPSYNVADVFAYIADVELLLVDPTLVDTLKELFPIAIAETEPVADVAATAPVEPAAATPAPDSVAPVAAEEEAAIDHPAEHLADGDSLKEAPSGMLPGAAVAPAEMATVETGEPTRKARIKPERTIDTVKAVINYMTSHRCEVGEAVSRLAPELGYGSNPASLARLYRKHHRDVRKQMGNDQRMSAASRSSSADYRPTTPRTSAQRKKSEPGQDKKP